MNSIEKYHEHFLFIIAHEKSLQYQIMIFNFLIFKYSSPNRDSKICHSEQIGQERKVLCKEVNKSYNVEERKEICLLVF